MRDFAAHIRVNNDEREIQTVKEHCENVSKIAKKYAKGLGMCRMAELQGLVHDLGKLNLDFNQYIRGENDMSRGQIDHCYAGAKYLMEIAEYTGDRTVIETARLISRTVISHHGIHDWIDGNGDDYFKDRIDKDQNYSETEANICHVISTEEILRLLRSSSEEYVKIKQKIAELCKKNQKGNCKAQQRVEAGFYMGQFERLMESILVDAGCLQRHHPRSGLLGS